MLPPISLYCTSYLTCIEKKKKGTIASLQEKGAVLELARLAADDNIEQVGRKPFLVENERNNLKGDVNCEIIAALLHMLNSKHTSLH